MTQGATAAGASAPVLSVQGLTVSVHGKPLVEGLSFDLARGETLAIAGESGSGKSITSLAVMGLLPPQVGATAGRILLEGRDLLTLPEAAMRPLRGGRIAMIFQEPMTSLNPVMTVGAQLVEAIVAHEPLPRAAARARALAALQSVRIAQPERRLTQYPHELSGGMRQRVMIAMALALRPDVLICDEPTTALDVTMEAQIIHLLRELRQDHHGAIVIVTHHLGVVGELCDRVYVMYAGEVVEEGTTDEIHHTPRHPYTQALIDCDPAHIAGRMERLPTIPGRLPDLAAPPPGCAFAARCPQAGPDCATPPPRVRLGPSHAALCHRVRP